MKRNKDYFICFAMYLIFTTQRSPFGNTYAGHSVLLSNGKRRRLPAPTPVLPDRWLWSRLK